MLLMVQREGPIGRYRLKEVVGLSDHEGVVRQMLADFQEQGHVAASRSGCTLTDEGHTLLAEALNAHHIAAIKRFDIPLLTPGPIGVAVHLRKRASRVRSAMKIRDLAVRAGALGATVITFKDEKLRVPSVSPAFFENYPDLGAKIHDAFRLEDDDVIAVISAEEAWRGFEASLTIARALSR
jgi:predicted transcriptional regulator